MVDTRGQGKKNLLSSGPRATKRTKITTRVRFQGTGTAMPSPQVLDSKKPSKTMPGTKFPSLVMKTKPQSRKLSQMRQDFVSLQVMSSHDRVFHASFYTTVYPYIPIP